MSASSTNISGVAARYAAALYDLAEERALLDETASDLARIREMLKESADLRRLVESPVFGREEQGRAIAAVFEKADLSEFTVRFAGVVAHNRRLFALDAMCVAFREILARRRGEISAEVTTARPLSDSQRKSLEHELQRAMGTVVTIDARVEDDIPGWHDRQARFAYGGFFDSHQASKT